MQNSMNHEILSTFAKNHEISIRSQPVIPDMSSHFQRFGGADARFLEPLPRGEAAHDAYSSRYRAEVRHSLVPSRVVGLILIRCIVLSVSLRFWTASLCRQNASCIRRISIDTTGNLPRDPALALHCTCHSFILLNMASH
jgi:hypothetical protein